MKPGWQTTEFWTTILAQVLALAALLGLITSSDSALLGDALGKCVTAVVMLLANASLVGKYVQGRLDLKLLTPGADAGDAPASDVLPFQRPG